MISGEWTPNQSNMIAFVLVNSAGAEVAGLGSAFSVFIAKAGGSFVAGVGTKSEIGNGWYRYIGTAAEANTAGPVAIYVTGAGAVQQNLEYVVGDRVVTAIEFTYTLTDSLTSSPIAGANIVIATDPAMANIVWTGATDGAGVARDIYGNLPRLEPGSYYIFSFKSGYIFNNPDLEVVS